MARDVERAAVADAGEPDRRADGEGGDRIEAGQLGRDMTLVVKHHDIGVKGTVEQQGVGAERAVSVDPLARRLRDRRPDDLGVLGAEQPALTGVWVDAGHTDPRTLDAEAEGEALGQALY